MLPILRILPVGGVLLAIFIMVLALQPPGGARPGLTPLRGALVDAGQHPEWRQFLMQAALRRGDELNRLRELPDKPAIMPDAPKVVGLPTVRPADLDDDTTGTVGDTPSLTIPVDIGETSRFELPVVVPEEKPPVVKTPERKARESRRRTIHRAARASRPAAVAVSNPFAALFGTTAQRGQTAMPLQVPDSLAPTPAATAITGIDPH